MINSVVLVSGVQQSDSVLYIHVFILFQIIFPVRLLQNIEQSSLCYTVGCSCLSILKLLKVSMTHILGKNEVVQEDALDPWFSMWERGVGKNVVVIPLAINRHEGHALAITDSMDVSLSELRELVMDREAWHAAMGSQRVGHDWATELNWTEYHLPAHLWIITTVTDVCVWGKQKHKKKKKLLTYVMF